jgi:hypothetical protein
MATGEVQDVKFSDLVQLMQTKKSNK